MIMNLKSSKPFGPNGTCEQERVAAVPAPGFRMMATAGRFLWLLLVAPLAAFGAEAPRIAPTEAAALVAADKAVLVDVREPAEWEKTGVARPAVLLAKSDFDGEQREWKGFLAANHDKKIIVYCRTGRRSGTVAEALAGQGLDVANAGGLQDWIDAGLPMREVKPTAGNK